MDIRIENHGSLFVFWPLSESAKSWVDENVAEPTFLGGTHAIVVEPRYARELADGMMADGLVVV